MTKELRDKAKELLSNKTVDLIIGYQRAPDGISAAPCLIDNERDTDELIWDAYCVYNLSNYLNPVRNNEILSKENKISNGLNFPGRKIGIVAKACDIKSITVLIQENQVKRKELVIIAVTCPGVIDEKRLGLAPYEAQEIILAEKCKTCKDRTNKNLSEIEQDEYESVRKLEAKSLLERFKFWEKEFLRCIRCYACRQICPLCYCPRCVADQINPAYFSKGASLTGNLSWNVTRAMHLAGRCTDCGECERACPVGIPLREINKKIEKEVKELFHYEAGLSAEQKPVLSCFDKNDPDDFIK